MKNFDKKTVIITLHINKDHSEVSWPTYRKMVEGGEFLEMLRNVTVPIELSMQGEDVSFLATVNPDIIDEIRSNSNIAVLQGSYSHALPSFFPGMLQDQLALSKKVLTHYLGEKVGYVGCLPEVDVSTPIIKFLKKAGWRDVLVLKDLHYTYNYRGNTDVRVPLVDETILRSEEMPLIVATGEQLRDIYNKFYRGFATAEEFVQALLNKRENFIVFLIDFEVPQINAIDGKSRIDLWKKFFKVLKDSPINFCHFEDPEIRQFVQDMALESPETQIYPRPMPKWHHSSELYKKIVKAVQHHSVDPRLLFRLAVSDNFSSIYYWPVCGEFPVKDSEARIVIKPDRDRRIQAFNYFLAKVKGDALPSICDEALQWYIENLEKAYQKEPS